MADAKKSSAGHSFRVRQQGHDVFVSGHVSKAAAKRAAYAELDDRVARGKPHGRGASGTFLAQALQDYGLKRLPFLKGAHQEARRINKYLRAAHLPVLVVTDAAVVRPDGPRFVVQLGPVEMERKIASSLHRHRQRQLAKTAGSDDRRAALACTKMGDIRRRDVQDFIDSLCSEGLGAATVALERALLRRLFNYAKAAWNWYIPDNPCTHLWMPKVDNVRDRVLTHEEQQLLDAAMDECHNAFAGPVVTLLLETSMRASEPLKNATWGDVDWERKVLRLKESKTDKRDVALSPRALAALRQLGPAEPSEPIVRISYEALYAAFRRACNRANIKGLNIHDLRHTAATRMALKTGNLFLVQALTGHKTLPMVQRYVNVGADDLVRVMHADEAADGTREPLAPEPTESALVDGEAVQCTVPVGTAALAVTCDGKTLALSAVELRAFREQSAALPSAQSGRLHVHEASVPAPAPAERTSNVVQFRRRA